MKVKTLAALGLAALATVGLASCVENEDPSTEPSTKPTETPKESSTSTTEQKKEFKKENYANGAYSYVASSYEDRTTILGMLEKYAVKNNLTGLTLFGNGGYVMYSPDIEKGTNTYIPGYGFGILSEGQITNDLATEAKTEWKRYYHTYSTDDPGTMNYMNSQGSDVGDFNGYAGASYWTTQMNETGDGYDWVGELSNSERPIAVNASANGLATKYKFEVKVGDQVKYNTNSNVPALKAFDGTNVKLEDYLTTYKILYTKKYGMQRMADNLKGAGSIKGAAAYVTASADGFNQAKWNDVGIKAYEEDGKAYLEFEFNIPCNTFYAMYYLSSSMHAPLPKEFVETLGNGDFDAGVKVFGNKTDGGWTPVDTYLSTGAYVPEVWDNTQIVFKKNPYYAGKLTTNENRYQIAGIHHKLFAAAKSDTEAVFNQFLAGNFHASSIPATKLDEYKDDSRTTTTKDSSTFKLNINSCTQEEWNALFGENGSVSKTTPDKYYSCKPIMSNDDFLAGLSYALNRREFAESIGRTPTADYFGSSYLSDPENGISYNSTQAHKDAVGDLQKGTDIGYSKEYAKASFKKACETLIAEGKYNTGDTVEITVSWMYTADIEDYGKKISEYWESAFNECGGGLTLKVNNEVGGETYMGVYNKMMAGTYDIGFGSISGNTLNPLNFLEVLKSDNSSTFTLNWGPNTNEVSEELYWDGAYWSFDSLWLAADQGGFFKDGVATPTFDVTGVDSVTKNADGTATVVINVIYNTVPDKVDVQITDAVIFGYFAVDGKAQYDEESIGEGKFVLSEDKTKVTCTVSQALVEKYSAALAQSNMGIDLYATATVLGIDSDLCKTGYFHFE